MIKEITIPDIGENVESGRVVSVLVKKGDMIDVDDGVIEFETEKAVVEIPSPEKGVITEILVSEGDEMKIGDVIAKLDTEAAAAKEGKEAEAKAVEKEPEEEEEEEAAEAAKTEEPVEREAAREHAAAKEAREEEREEAPKKKEPERAEPRRVEREEAHHPRVEERKRPEGPAPASPSVRRLARELGVDVYQVEGSGPGGRITDSDVKEHVKRRGAKPEQPRRPEPGERKAIPVASAIGQPELPDFSRWGDIERVEMSTVRRITAESVSISWSQIPHVTQSDKADITHLQEFIDKNAKRVEKAGGKLTITAILLKVMAEGLKRFPRFNASIDVPNNELIFKNYVHIGMAVDTDRGLLVPVIRDVDKKSIVELAVEVVDIANRARNKKVSPDEFEGGTFTISNQGGIGGVDFTPIVLWPQVAILGVSRAAVEPRYRGHRFRPRTILPLSLSYDHRVVDGADAARFLRWVCESLENPFAMYME